LVPPLPGANTTVLARDDIENTKRPYALKGMVTSVSRSEGFSIAAVRELSVSSRFDGFGFFSDVSISVVLLMCLGYWLCYMPDRFTIVAA
jgi:hypothetical protein